MRRYVGIICSLVTIFFVNKAIACEASSSTQVASELNSDHTLLFSHFGNGRIIRQLNVAQPNALQIFADKFNQEYGFNWSSLLRTPKMLRLVKDNEKTLNGYVISMRDTIVNRKDIDVAEKNQLLEAASRELVSKLIDLGFPVKDMKMVPHKLFNPDATPEDFRGPGAEKLIKGPIFILENTESFTDRLSKNFADLMKDGPDFATTQEIPFGTSDGVNYTNIHTDVLKNYPAYDFVTIERKDDNFMAVSVTYYDKNKWSNVSKQHEVACASIADKMKCFSATNGKIIVSAFEHKQTKEIWYVSNIHGDYGKANKFDKPVNDPWDIQEELLLSQPGLICAGDYNLMKKNEDFIKGKPSMKLLTPEPAEFNPTWDAIFVSSK